MFSTIHVNSKPVKIDVSKIESDGFVSEFSDNPFEITFEANDKSFSLVGYLSPAELEVLGERIKQELFNNSLRGNNGIY